MRYQIPANLAFYCIKADKNADNRKKGVKMTFLRKFIKSKIKIRLKLPRYDKKNRIFRLNLAGTNFFFLCIC